MADQPATRAQRRPITETHFAILPAEMMWVLDRELLSHPKRHMAAIILFKLIAVLAERGHVRNVNWIRIPGDTLGAPLGVTDRTVRTHLKWLVDQGYVVRNVNDPTLYAVNPSFARVGHGRVPDKREFPAPRYVLTLDARQPVDVESTDQG